MEKSRFDALSARNRALIAMAVLLDGHEAAAYLENDAEYGEVLERVAHDLATLAPDLRMPFVGTLLRAAVSELEMP